MPLLLRPTAPSPSIDELAFAVTAAPLSSQASQRSVSSAVSELPRCPTHGRISLRRRRSTAGTETDLHSCTEEACQDLEHQSIPRSSQQSMRSSGILKPKDSEKAFRDSKRSSHDTQLDEDRMSSDGSYASEAERVSSVLSCGCSCADANEFAITSSTVVIEDRQLAVVDKELRDYRKTLVRKLYSRLTKISGLGRRKPSTAKPVF
ncbi:hypothetical protein L917_08047 [Phytophthora nicotianae]|uniref:Uncharacterized protein n=3 Tax=Phytophthora nicotianae TaxID=4792 RepID=W2QAQ5_PHYN3|nr:hypothetical protein PPTG_11758 [Phytophthora nicotianae INRA-310]ETL93894.1 hypothetical protein L917_08047 [Phytophthora nicotianae]ETN09335.1 hypothetical protein PPTG_11758 [Phytophthora nicotianae INRA-310]ETO76055.1 hypothetical protein F444_08448 [Phytophthora nicotianae P1976]KUF75911.1 hypothetical protein AM587_10008697 [Phytophthora nicotianae]